MEVEPGLHSIFTGPFPAVAERRPQRDPDEMFPAKFIGGFLHGELRCLKRFQRNLRFPIFRPWLIKIQTAEEAWEEMHRPIATEDYHAERFIWRGHTLPFYVRSDMLRTKPGELAAIAGVLHFIAQGPTTELAALLEAGKGR